MMAAILDPSAIEGNTRLFSESAPVVGNHFRFTENTMISIKPTQNEGSDMPDTASVIPV